jgi:hypothetical protein
VLQSVGDQQKQLGSKYLTLLVQWTAKKRAAPDQPVRAHAMIPEILEAQLQQFCKRYGLIVSTKYRDSEVISIQIVDDQAATYQLWLENFGTEWTVKGWECNGQLKTDTRYQAALSRFVRSNSIGLR